MIKTIYQNRATNKPIKIQSTETISLKIRGQYKNYFCHSCLWVLYWFGIPNIRLNSLFPKDIDLENLKFICRLIGTSKKVCEGLAD
jgi:hypothetical protein